jgi:hypothetical protein
MSRADEQAFPVPAVAGLPNGHAEYGAAGITIREHFAAMAMQGVLVRSHLTTNSQSACAKLAVEHADALLAALSKPTGSEK